MNDHLFICLASYGPLDHDLKIPFEQTLDDNQVFCRSMYTIDWDSAMGGILPLYKVLYIYFSYVYKVSPQSKW